MARPNGYQNGEERMIQVEELSDIGFHVTGCEFFQFQRDFQHLDRNVSLYSEFYDTTTMEETLDVSSLDKSKFYKKLQQCQTFANRFSSPIRMPPALSTIAEANNESSKQDITLTELGDTLMESENEVALDLIEDRKKRIEEYQMEINHSMATLSRNLNETNFPASISTANGFDSIIRALQMMDTQLNFQILCCMFNTFEKYYKKINSGAKFIDEIYKAMGNLESPDFSLFLAKLALPQLNLCFTHAKFGKQLVFILLACTAQNQSNIMNSALIRLLESNQNIRNRRAFSDSITVTIGEKALKQMKQYLIKLKMKEDTFGSSVLQALGHTV